MESSTTPLPGGVYNGANNVLFNSTTNQYSGSAISSLIPDIDTSSWYTAKPNQGCLRTDPTRVARFHTFPDAALPRGMPLDPGADARVCGLVYGNPWPMQQLGVGAAADMVDTEMSHPQFGFKAGAGGPPTRYQIDVESELRTLNTINGHCYEPIVPMDAPLFRNEVAPPPVVGLDPRVQNAANPVQTIVGPRGDGCRAFADAVAVSMSGRWIGNPTRQDTMRMDLPFGPPGIGSGAARGPTAPVKGEPYFTNSPQGLAQPPPKPVPIFHRVS